MNVWQRALVVGCCCAATAVAARADNVPPEWGGIWSMQIESRDCTTNALLFSTSELDTICPNLPFPAPGGTGFDLTCTTTATATTFTTHCTGSSEVVTGCTANFTYDISGTLGSGSFSSTGTISTTYTGDCFGLPNSCHRITQTATRIAPPPNPCQRTPIEQESWGGLKSHYE